jgi:hypothetical protein
MARNRRALPGETGGPWYSDGMLDTPVSIWKWVTRHQRWRYFGFKVISIYDRTALA